MALSRASAMFKLYPAKHVHKQRAKLRPIEHHYENEGEEPYIKYGCQICEQLAENARGFHFEDGNGNDAKFTKFSFPKGTERCPCCGVYINWDIDLKIRYNNENNEIKNREYNTIMDFVDEMESDEVDIPMLDYDMVEATFFGNRKEYFITIAELLEHCKEIIE